MLRRSLWIASLLVACTGPRPGLDAATDAPTDTPTDMGIDVVIPPAAALPDLTADPAQVTGCTSTAPAAGHARAKRIECDAERSNGPLAMGRVGDVVIENARVRYTIRGGTESASVIGAPAGGVIDATLQDSRRIDALKEFLLLLNYHGVAIGDLSIVRAEGSSVVVRAPFMTRAVGLIAATLGGVWQRPRVHGVLEYALNADDDVLRETICAIPDVPGATIPAPVGSYMSVGGRLETIVPGTGVLDDDTPGATGNIWFGESPDVAFGVTFQSGAFDVVHAKTSNIFIASGRTSFEWSTLHCVGVQYMVGPTEAHVANVLYGSSGTQAVDVNVPSGGRAEIRDAAGHAVLRSRETGGAVHAMLPAGTYTTQAARARGTFGDPASPPPTGTLVVLATVTGETGAPVRLTVQGVSDPTFEERYVATAETRRMFPTGTYHVTASRGMEYTLASADVTIPADAEVRFDPTIAHTIDTGGYVSTDFHLHSELSTDSTHPIDDAIRQMSGEGLDLVASTDHDFVTDAPALVAASDVMGWIVAVPGDEVSTTRLGHFGGYPLRRDETRAGANALPWFDLSPGQIFQGLRDRGTDVVVQVNHPYLGGSGFFQRIGLDPATGMPSADPVTLGLPAGTDLSDLSFEALEVWNGYTRGGNEQALNAFLSLRTGGRRYVMVGNSDSHRPDLPPGAPRSFVRVPDDTRGHYTWDAVRAGLRSGDVSVGSGIFVDAHTSTGVRPGGLATPTSGRITLHVRVQAPPWADCTRLRIYRGTDVVIDQPITTARDQAIRFEGDLTVDTPVDTFLSARADGTADASPVFPWPPFGITNPLQIDANGDGH